MAQGNPYSPGLGVPPMGYSPPPAGDPRATSLQRGLLVLMLPLHGIMGFSQGASFVTNLYFHVLRVDQGYSSAYESGYWVGQGLVQLCMLTWALVGGVWAFRLRRSLHAASPRLERSLRNYWLSSALSCFCLPIGIIGLINLARPEVQSAIAGRPDLSGR